MLGGVISAGCLHGVVGYVLFTYNLDNNIDFPYLKSSEKQAIVTLTLFKC